MMRLFPSFSLSLSLCLAHAHAHALSCLRVSLCWDMYGMGDLGWLGWMGWDGMGWMEGSVGWGGDRLDSFFYT
jgi:hypothetical protein